MSTPQTVSFPSGNAYVVGHLYLPANYVPTQRYPAVAVAGSFTSVKEMMGGTYAGELARRGVMAVAIDYRNYGQSGGEFRQYEDPEAKSEDFSAALSFLASRSDVSGTGLLGICTSGGNVFYPAASDPKVQVIATVVGYFQSPELLRQMMGGEEGIARRRADGHEAATLYENTHEIKLISAYGGDANSSVNPGGPRPYYEDPARGNVREWRNEFAMAAWNSWLDWDPVSQASLVKVPTLMVHSERAAFPNQARAVYDRLGGQKEIVWADGDHYDFYDNPDSVSVAADKVADHFHKTLGQDSGNS